MRKPERCRRPLSCILAGVVLFNAASIGPMSVWLNQYCDSAGANMVWETVYNEPLASLPKPVVRGVNRYLGFWSGLNLKLPRELRLAVRDMVRS
jgi:hypothetical protein